MDRLQKKETVATLKEVFTGASTVVVTHYRGMTVAETTRLRQEARKQGATVKVTKNTLARIAANDTAFDGISDLFTGPTAIAYSDDAVAAAKAIVDFAKDNDKLVIVGGSIDGKLLDEAGVKALAGTATLDESRAKIVGLLQAPASKIASVLQAPGGQVARVISAYSSKDA